MKFGRLLGVLIILVFAISLAVQTASANIIRNSPSELGIYDKEAVFSIPGLNDFARSVQNNVPDQIQGIYAQGGIAFPVVQQPISNAGYVSDAPDTVTEFQLAAQYNSIGMLAHDYLAGASFSKLQPGNILALVYGDGSLKYFRVYEVQRYQALTPTSPYSKFVDLSDQVNFTTDQLFYRTYGLGNSTLVLQTCISTSSIPSWGRLFVLARPVEPSRPDLKDALSWLEIALAAPTAH